MLTPRPSLIKRWLLTATFLICSACSQLEYWQLNEYDQLNYLIEQNQYHKALALIQNSSPKSPYHEQLKSQHSAVLKKQNSFVKNTIRESQQLVKKRQWPQAIELLSNALNYNPEQSKFTEQLNNTLHSQQTFIRKQQLALASLQASQHQQRQRIIEQLLQADPEQYHLNTQLRNEQKIALSNYQLLLTEAENAAQQKKWQQARNYIQLAKQLNSNHNVSTLEKKVTEALYQDQQKQQSQALNLQRMRNAQLAKKLSNQSQAQQWLAAQQTIIQLQQQQHLSSDHQQLIMDTLKSLAEHINQLVQKGQHNYTNGKLDLAIEYWQQAQALAPNDENINQKLHRAKRFQQNLNKLP